LKETLEMNTQHVQFGSIATDDDDDSGDELTASEDLVAEFKDRADWRRKTDAKYPGHPGNLCAAAAFERFAQEVPNIPSDLLEKYDLIMRKASDAFHYAVVKQVGFR
jgi:hypothetical protein